jgi:hypothetical protein
LTYDWIVHILFQYIAGFKVSSLVLQDESVQGFEGSNGDTIQMPGVGEIRNYKLVSSLQSTLWLPLEAHRLCHL